MRKEKSDNTKSSKNCSIHLYVINSDSHLQSQTNFSPTKQIKSNSYVSSIRQKSQFSWQVFKNGFQLLLDSSKSPSLERRYSYTQKYDVFLLYIQSNGARTNQLVPSQLFISSWNPCIKEKLSNPDHVLGQPSHWIVTYKVSMHLILQRFSPNEFLSVET